MIYSVRGKLILRETELAVIECGGVGYACRTTLQTLASLGEKGSEVTLYTHLHVREDCMELFGFATKQELNCFKMLISVSGVGPKAALSILSDVNSEQFALLVASEDSKTLTKTKGIGAKTAQRIVLELKDKIVKENNIDFSAAAGGPAIPASDGSSVSEAFSALLVLGYTQSEVAPVLAGLDQRLPSAELIRQSLKIMAQKMN
ncbi:Holliday junction branch migration protein RuvA [Ruminococcus sp. HUN007]|uniref:Holliday junction branch migration protein RuvA n=1 Tax=Ruminococcus sp. HUN007 TaxID=1514668 RepID=UPI0005D2A8C5|nr:Holliday junction branch migration protein RuvA [Ruminococcus sp. HUN007]